MLHDAEQDLRNHERIWISIIIATIFGGGAVLLLACVGLFGLFVMLAAESRESKPDEAERWFKTVVQDDVSAFSEIQHYADQGIDYSHHFKFAFEDIDDLSSIIRKYDLIPTHAEPMRLEYLPSWYDPYLVPADAPRFGCDGAEPVLLIVDPSAKIAYFELAHL